METINPEKLLVRVFAVLDKLQLRYFVTGGFAISVWGRPRATFDIDIVLHLIEPDIKSLIRALKEISPEGYADEEMIKMALDRKGEFNFIDGETGVKVDFWIAKDDDLTVLQFKRRILKIIDGKKVYFISPEDLILSKLLWHESAGTSRHLEDVESVFKISGKKLDMKYLKKWAKKLGVSKKLDKFTNTNFTNTNN